MQPGERAHGVTPGLSHDYGRRTAERQGAFARAWLRPGMRLIDVGCGPGSITVGLAEAVAPGQVMGIDRDAAHIESARALAAECGIANVVFEVGDALGLSIGEDSFDAAFENDLFVHLADRAVDAAREVWRVLRPGGLFASRDTDAEAAVWGARSDGLREFDRLFFRWQASRGSDLALGRRLPEILRAAGFVDLVTSVSADTKSTRGDVEDHARIMAFLLDGPLGQTALANGWANRATLAEIAPQISAWGAHPDAFFANVHVEVVGRKPA